MSKIICDVCGTSYPESANQCPICGCVRSGDAVTVRGNTNKAEVPTNGNYTHVKGGRFSKSNVKKRNQGKPVPTASAPQKEDKPKKEGKGDKALIVTVFVLLIAIVAIVIYIAVYFFAPGQSKPDQNATQNPAETTQQTVETTEATVLEIPCEELDVSDTVIELDKAGAALLLNVTPTPKNTTDPITYATSDEAVAVVTENGKVVAVGNGQAIITVTCGEFEVECCVICTIEPEVEETTVQPSAEAAYEISHTDVTIKVGETFRLSLKDKEGKKVEVSWISANGSICSVSNGTVTGLAKGQTTVNVTVDGVTYSCIVRVY